METRPPPKLVIWLYRLLLPVAALFSAPYYLRRMLRRGGYGKDLRKRFGLWPRLPKQKPGSRRIWIQAVSVGELSSIATLLHYLTEVDNLEIVLSGTTSTGLKLAAERHGSRVLAHGPFPLDWLPFSALAWRRIRPDLIAMVDSELWPEHLRQARRRNIPAVILNARLSNRSHARLARAGLFRSLLLPPNLNVFASSEKQRERWLEVGALKQQTLATGNLKFDSASLSLPDAEERNALLDEFGFPSDSLVIAGISTWPGEEKALLDALRAAHEANIPASLLLIPRHAERRNELRSLLSQASDLTHHFRSDKRQAPGDTSAYIADTTGELTKLIRCADLAFVGKTLHPHHGGQNPAEPAAIALPLLIGPNYQNFTEACESLLQTEAAELVPDSDSLRQTVLRLLRSPEERSRTGQAARQWAKAHDGAASRTLQAIRDLLPT